MNNQTVIFYFPYIGNGGTESLCLRLAKWCISNSYRVIFLTQNKGIDHTLQAFLDIGMECYFYDRKKQFFFNEENKKLLLYKEEAALVISFTIVDFLVISSLLSKIKIAFSYCLYVIHPKWTSFGNSLWIKPMILKLLQSNKIIFMDEECRDACILRYKLDYNKYKFKIVRLPIRIDPVLSKPKNKIINILSISRFDFPFKGYLLGLVDSFVSMAVSNENLKLTIIGGNKKNKNTMRLIEKINHIPKNIQQRINILDVLPYSKLLNYIDNCDVYIGMGTTILEAANRNKICIIALAYQENDLSVGFFDVDDNYKARVCYNEKDQYLHFTDLIQDVIFMDEEYFIEKENKTKLILDTYYNIDKNAKEIIKFDTCLNHRFIIYLSIYQFLLHILFILKKYSCILRIFTKVKFR
jgi:hypothetical protein